MKPKVLLAFAATFFHLFFQVMSDDSSIPSTQGLAFVGIISEYIFLFLVTRSMYMWNFSGLKDIPQCDSYSCRLSKSCWSWSLSALDFIYLHMMFSSENSQYYEFTCSDMFLKEARKRICLSTFNSIQIQLYYNNTIHQQLL